MPRRNYITYLIVRQTLRIRSYISPTPAVNFTGRIERRNIVPWKFDWEIAFNLRAQAATPHQKYIRGRVVRWNWNRDSDTVPITPLIFTGDKKCKILPRFFITFAFDALSFKNWTMYLKIRLTCAFEAPMIVPCIIYMWCCAVQPSSASGHYPPPYSIPRVNETVKLLSHQ